MTDDELKALDAKARAVGGDVDAWKVRGYPMAPESYATMGILHSHNHTPVLSPPIAAYIAAASPDVILRLTAELRKTREEAQALRERIAEGHLVSAGPSDKGGFQLTLRPAREIVEALCSGMAEMLGETANYIECELGPYTTTIQRRERPTPHEKRIEAEKERDALRDRVAELESAQCICPACGTEWCAGDTQRCGTSICEDRNALSARVGQLEGGLREIQMRPCNAKVGCPHCVAAEALAAGKNGRTNG